MMTTADPPNRKLDQLKRALDAKLIDQETYDMAVTALQAGISAQWVGTGAIAQGEKALAVGAQGVGIGGSNYGMVNTGVILNIQGDDVEKHLELARVINAASLLAPPMDAERVQRITDYYNEIARTLDESAAILKQRVVPYGKCGELDSYAMNLPADIGDAIGVEQAHAFAQKLKESHEVESFGAQYFHLPQAEMDAIFSKLEEAAGYFRAAAKSLRVKRS